MPPPQNQIQKRYMLYSERNLILLWALVKVTEFLAESVEDLQSFFSTQLPGQTWERHPLS